MYTLEIVRLASRSPRAKSRKIHRPLDWQRVYASAVRPSPPEVNTSCDSSDDPPPGRPQRSVLGEQQRYGCRRLNSRGSASSVWTRRTCFSSSLGEAVLFWDCDRSWRRGAYCERWWLGSKLVAAIPSRRSCLRNVRLKSLAIPALSPRRPRATRGFLVQGLPPEGE